MPFYKATDIGGRDFWTGRINYAEALKSRESLPAKQAREHPVVPSDAVYTAADVPTEITGIQWPCRLFEVDGKPVGDDSRHTFGFLTLRVLREVDPWQVFGPQGVQVCAMLARAETLSWDDLLFLGQFWEDQLEGWTRAAGQYVVWAHYMHDARTTARLYHRGSAFRAAWSAARSAVDQSRVRETAARTAAGLECEQGNLRFLGYAAEVVAAAVSGQLLEDIMTPDEKEWLARAWTAMIAASA